MTDTMLIFLLASAALAAGAVLGGLSAFAANRRHSADDLLADAIDAQLPQLQCAECGYPGCKPFALAVARKEAAINLCLPGGEDVVRRLAEVVNETPPTMANSSRQKPAQGREKNDWIPAFAGMTGNKAGNGVAKAGNDVAETGNDAAKMENDLAKTKNDTAQTNNNAGMTEKANHSGIEVAFIRREDCVGCALCLPACPTDAIVGAARLEHSVLEKDCTGCTLCLPVCPTDAIEMRPPKKRTTLNQTLAGFRAASSAPQHSNQQCIRCNLCADVCPAGLAPMNLYALSMDEQWDKMTNNNLAQCIHCKKCDDVCPAAIPLSATFARAKNKASKIIKAKDEAARLKTRYEQRQKRQTPPPPPAINAKAKAAAAKARLHQ